MSKTKTEKEQIEIDWNFIKRMQEKIYPNWKKTKPRTLFATALSSEVGAICDQITHLDGGGTQLLDNNKWNNKKILHDIADSFVMLVLIAEKSGFTYYDFMEELDRVKDELESRYYQRKLSLPPQAKEGK